MSEFLIAVSAAVLFLFGFIVIWRLGVIFNKAIEKTEELRIGMEYPGMEAVIAKELEIISEKYPNLTFDLISDNKSYLCHALEADEIDIAIVAGEHDSADFECFGEPLKISPVISEATGLIIVSRNSREAACIMRKASGCKDICFEFYQLVRDKTGC